MSKYKDIFAKGHTPSCSEDVFVIKKVKDNVPWTYVIEDLNGEENVWIFYEKELWKTNQTKVYGWKSTKEKILCSVKMLRWFV